MLDLMDAQCAAEDAVIALGYEVRSVLDPQSGTLVLYLMTETDYCPLA